jgi:hypothetical protein
MLILWGKDKVCMQVWVVCCSLESNQKVSLKVRLWYERHLCEVITRHDFPKHDVRRVNNKHEKGCVGICGLLVDFGCTTGGCLGA